MHMAIEAVSGDSWGFFPKESLEEPYICVHWACPSNWCLTMVVSIVWSYTEGQWPVDWDRFLSLDTICLHPGTSIFLPKLQVIILYYYYTGFIQHFTILKIWLHLDSCDSRITSGVRTAPSDTKMTDNHLGVTSLWQIGENWSWPKRRIVAPERRGPSGIPYCTLLSLTASIP